MVKILGFVGSIVVPISLTLMSFNANATEELALLVDTAIDNGDITTMQALLDELGPKADSVCASEVTTQQCQEYSPLVQQLQNSLEIGVR